MNIIIRHTPFLARSKTSVGPNIVHCSSCTAEQLLNVYSVFAKRWSTGRDERLLVFSYVGGTSHRSESIRGRNRTVHVIQVRTVVGESYEEKTIRTTLYESCFKGHLPVVRYLVEEKKSDPTRVDTRNRGMCPLHCASVEGHLDVVKYLIRKCHCDPNCKDERGCTPLHYSAARGHMKIIQYLIETCHCNPNCTDKSGRTPLHEPLHQGNMHAIRYLIEVGHSNLMCAGTHGTALHCACEEGHIEVIKYLIETLHSDPNLKDYHGRTPLHVACLDGNIKVIKLLIETGRCDPNCVDVHGFTALHKPIHQGNMDVIKYLIKAGHFDPMHRDNNGDTSLHCACEEGHVELVTYLIETCKCDPSCINKKGWAPLHLASEKGHLDVVRCLLQDRDCNLNVNIGGWTPLLLATEYKHPAVARELVRAGAHAEESPPKPQVKVFFVGNPSVGKTSLKEALLAETSQLWVLLASITGPKLVCAKQQTPGIIPYMFESKKYGLVTFYDLAGQQEYYASHSALLKDSITSSLFIIVVNLCDSEQEIKQKLAFWISFLANHCASVITKPHVIIVGSHSDVVKSRGEEPGATVNLEFIKTMHVVSGTGFHISTFIPMDCRQSNSYEIITLAKSMKKSCDALRKQLESAYHFHLLFVHLLVYNDVSAVSFDEVSKDFSDDSELHDDLSELHDRGDIVYLKGNKRWIILDKDALLSEVNGVLFAPENFEQHCNLANATGVVPLSKLAQKFSEHSPDMLVQFLSYFEFCREIPNCEVLELINQDQEHTPQSETTNKRYLFFPGLITSTIYSGVWDTRSQFPHACGWMLKCCESGQLLTSQFLQVVLLRIAFSCALASEESTDFPVLQRRCSIWKSGIYWGSRKGVEALVEIRDPPQNKLVVVMLRCMSGKEVECARLRSTIILTVYEAKEKLCPKVPTKEYFLHPSQVKEYSLKPPAKKKLFSITEVSRAVIRGEDCVVGPTGEPIDLKTLLLVEPYTNLNAKIFQELFNEETKVVSDRFLYSITECIHNKNKKDVFRTMLKVPQGRLEDLIASQQPPFSEFKTCFLLLQCWRGDSGTYKSLRETLDQFSVFARRNPMQLADFKSLECENAQ